jgi:hypothetical protein
MARNGPDMEIYINIDLTSWGRVCARVNIKHGVYSVKSIELLEDQFIDLNDGDFLEYRNLSTMDIQRLKSQLSEVVNRDVH